MSSILTNYSSSSEKWLKPPATAAECSVYTSPDILSLSFLITLPDYSTVPFSPITSLSDTDIIHQTLNGITCFENKIMMEPIMKERVVGNITGDHISVNVIFNISSKPTKSLKRCRVIYSDSDSD